jgi:broad specificity phosphatase PhoE
MSITFVRHGESTTNAMIPGLAASCCALTPKGVLQAERLRPLLPDPGLVITSPFARAKETALCALGSYTEVWPVQEFTYLPDSAAGSPTENESYWDCAEPTMSIAPPATESFVQFIRRVRTALNNLEGVDATVFSHSQFIKAVYWVIKRGGSSNMKAFRKFKTTVRLPNTAIVRLHWDGRRWQIDEPDVAHLPEHERD